MSEESDNWQLVTALDDVASGDRLSLVIDDTPALLLRIENTVFIVEDVCSHDGQPLDDGEVSGQTIACPRHGANFDLCTGKALSMPATESIRTFPTEIRDGNIWVNSAP